MVKRLPCKQRKRLRVPHEALWIAGVAGVRVRLKSGRIRFDPWVIHILFPCRTVAVQGPLKPIAVVRSDPRELTYPRRIKASIGVFDTLGWGSIPWEGSGNYTLSRINCMNLAILYPIAYNLKW